MTQNQAMLAVAIMAGVTLFTRAVPFLLFDRGERPPQWILYFGRVLPPAVIAMLIVYCLRWVKFHSLGEWVPSLLASVVVVGLHVWKRNNMLSILGGTILYMVLIQGMLPM